MQHEVPVDVRSLYRTNRRSFQSLWSVPFRQVLPPCSDLGYAPEQLFQANIKTTSHRSNLIKKKWLNGYFDRLHLYCACVRLHRLLTCRCDRIPPEHLNKYKLYAVKRIQGKQHSPYWKVNLRTQYRIIQCRLIWIRIYIFLNPVLFCKKKKTCLMLTPTHFLLYFFLFVSQTQKAAGAGKGLPGS